MFFTYFAGDKQLGIPADEEVREIWLELGYDYYLRKLTIYQPSENNTTFSVTECLQIEFYHLQREKTSGKWVSLVRVAPAPKFM